MTIVSDVEFVEGKHKLQRLCPRSHDYKGTGQSISRINASTCLYCQRENSAKSQQAKRDAKAAQQKAADLLIPTQLVDAIKMNESKHMLGDLCIRRHDYLGTRQSLRRIRTDVSTGVGNCVYCQKEDDQNRVKDSVDRRHTEGVSVKYCYCNQCMEIRHGTTEEIDFDTEVFRLGGLCIRGHEWKNSGKTLRYIKDRGCPICSTERGSRLYYSRQQWERLVAKIRYRLNREAELERGRKYRRENPDKARESWRKYQDENRVFRQARARVLSKNPERRIKANIKGHERRANKLSKRHEKYTPEQLNQRYSLWNNTCSYCGADGKQTVEHVIPIAHPEGCDVLSNIIPACRECNCYSKRDEPLILWYQKQPFFDVERLLKILFSLGEEELRVAFRDVLDTCRSPN